MTQTLTLAETARSLMARANRAVLGSLSEDSSPFSSLVELAPLENGDAVLLMSDLAQHAKNLKADARASVLLSDDLNSSLAFARGRPTLTGSVTLTEDAAHQAVFKALHPKSLLGGFHDFKLYHFAVSRAQVVAGFGRAGRVTLEVYQDSKPDLLALSLPGIVSHMNQDHAQNLLDYAHALLEKPWAAQAVLLGIDRYGMDLHVSDADKTEVVRYVFETPLENAAASRALLVKLSQVSRDKLGKSA